MNILWEMDPPVLTSSGPEWQFHIATDIWWSGMVIGRYASRSTPFPSTDIQWSRMAISYCYWHLVVQNGNFTLLLTSSGPEWQFHIATDIWWSGMVIGRYASRSTPFPSTDIQWSRMAISYCYWHLVVQNGNFTLLLTSSGQEWQFHIATDIHWSRFGNFTLLLTYSSEDWKFFTAAEI